MTQNTEAQGIQPNGQLPLEGTPHKKPRRRTSKGRWRGRPNHDDLMIEIAQVFAHKDEFTVLEVQAWLTRSDNGKQPSEAFVNDLFGKMVALGLIGRTGECRDRYRLYTVVDKSAAQSAPAKPLSLEDTSPEAMLNALPRVTPEPAKPAEHGKAHALSVLDSLESLGVDTTEARAGLDRAFELKKRLEALAPKKA